MPPNNWTARLLGMGSVLDELNDLTIEVGSDAVYVVGTNVTYSVHQEFGTVYQDGTPHLRPAIRSTQSRIGQLAQKADSGDDLIRLIALDIEAGAKRRAPVDTGNLRASYTTERVE